MQKQAITAQQQLKSQEMAAQVALQKIELETQSKVKIKQAEVAFEIEKNKNEAALKSQLMQQEFNYNVQLRDVSEQALAFREGAREQAKSDRISQQKTFFEKPDELRRPGFAATRIAGKLVGSLGEGISNISQAVAPEFSKKFGEKYQEIVPESVERLRQRTFSPTMSGLEEGVGVIGSYFVPATCWPQKIMFCFLFEERQQSFEVPHSLPLLRCLAL